MAEREFDEVLIAPAGNRPLMSKPGRYQATRKVIREVMDVTGITDEAKAIEVADWLVNKMERYAAHTARGVFDMDGNGPQCSWCGTIWPLCGHHHMSDERESDGILVEGEVGK